MDQGSLSTDSTWTFVKSPSRGIATESLQSILTWLVEDNGELTSFVTHCDANKYLFGSKQDSRNRSSYRRKCRDQLVRLREKWRNDPNGFIKLLRSNQLHKLADKVANNEVATPKQEEDAPIPQLKGDTPKKKLDTRNDFTCLPKTETKTTTTSFETSSRSIMSGGRKKVRTDDGEWAFEYELDFDCLNNNQGGVIPLYEPKLRLSDFERCGKVTLLFVVNDLRDVAAGRYQAKLLNDRSGVVVRRPICPEALQVHTELIYKQRLEERKCLPQDRDAHEILVTRLSKPGNEAENISTIIYRAPEGFKFSNVKFNDGIDPHSLELSADGKVDGVAGKKAKTFQVKTAVYYIYWELLVDGSTEAMRGRTGRASVDDPIVARFKGMVLVEDDDDAADEASSSDGDRMQNN